MGWKKGSWGNCRWTEKEKDGKHAVTFYLAVLLLFSFPITSSLSHARSITVSITMLYPALLHRNAQPEHFVLCSTELSFSFSFYVPRANQVI